MGTRPAGLDWGQRYLMVRPDHFRVAYAINPFMDLADQPDPVLARAQWDAVGTAIKQAGGEVAVLAQRSDSPDMVYAMNLGFVVVATVGEQVVLSHMRHLQRRNETTTAAEYFSARGARLHTTGCDGVGAHFEAGDAFAWRGDLVLGYGQRSERLAAKHLAEELGAVVHRFHITHPAMYHLDLSFCPLDQTRAMVCPAAYDEESAARLLTLVPEPLVLTEAEALSFCANSIVVDQTVIMPACPDRVRSRLEAWGFQVVLVDVSEFLKGGGAIRCLTNPLDVRIGRDLVPVDAQVMAAGSTSR